MVEQTSVRTKVYSVYGEILKEYTFREKDITRIKEEVQNYKMSRIRVCNKHNM